MRKRSLVLKVKPRKSKKTLKKKKKVRYLVS